MSGDRVEVYRIVWGHHVPSYVGSAASEDVLVGMLKSDAASRRLCVEQQRVYALRVVDGQGRRLEERIAYGSAQDLETAVRDLFASAHLGLGL